MIPNACASIYSAIICVVLTAHCGSVVHSMCMCSCIIQRRNYNIHQWSAFVGQESCASSRLSSDSVPPSSSWLSYIYLNKCNTLLASIEVFAMRVTSHSSHGCGYIASLTK